MKTTSVTDLGRELFNKAFEFKMVMSKEKVSLKFVACGNEYFVDLDQETMVDPKGSQTAWLSVFKQFEKDLDAGIHENKERIIQPETKLIL